MVYTRVYTNCWAFDTIVLSTACRNLKLRSLDIYWFGLLIVHTLPMRAQTDFGTKNDRPSSARRVWTKLLSLRMIPTCFKFRVLKYIWYKYKNDHVIVNSMNCYSIIMINADFNKLGGFITALSNHLLSFIGNCLNMYKIAIK